MRVIAAVLLMFTLVAVDAPAQSPLDIDQDAAKQAMPGLAGAGHENPALIELRVAAIEQELAALKNQHEWAGRYYFGDGLGANLQLHLAPQTGFAVTWHGCLGLYGANEGQIAVRPDGVIDLDFRWKNLNDRFGQFARHLLPVRWGERHYLVDADNLAQLVNYIHEGIEPRASAHGGIYLRDGDEKLAAPGLPSLPPAWLNQIRWQPLEFAVLSVEPIKFAPKHPDVMLKARVELQLLAPSVLAAGQSADLMPGIELRPVESSGDYSGMKTISSAYGRVQAEWSRGFATADEHPEPVVGGLYSTGSFDPKRLDELD